MGGMMLLLSLLWMMSVMGQQRIIYVKQSLTWSQAQAYCRRKHIDLVTIKTDAENNQITQNSWLGMYRDSLSSNWKWSRGDEPNTFNNTWNGNDPDDGEDCGYKDTKDNGAWRSKSCGENRNFFCLDDSLFLVSQMKTWQEALIHCRFLSTVNRTYDLATLHPMDHDFVKSKISNQVWTGLRFLGDRWVWVGGEKVQYDDLTSCPESKRCGVVDKMTDKLYNIADCEEQRDFFCYKKSSIV